MTRNHISSGKPGNLKRNSSFPHSPALAQTGPPLPSPTSLSANSYILWERKMYKYKVQLGCGPILTTLLLLLTPQYLRLLTWLPQRPPRLMTLSDHIEGSLEHLESRPRVIRSKVAVPEDLCLHWHRLHYIPFTSYLPSHQNEPEFAPFSDQSGRSPVTPRPHPGSSPQTWRLKSSNSMIPSLRFS